MFRNERNANAMRVEAKLEKKYKDCGIWIFQSYNDSKFEDGFHAFIGIRNGEYTDGMFGEHIKHAETLEGLLG